MFNLFNKRKTAIEDHPVHKEVYVEHWVGTAKRSAKPMRGEKLFPFLDRAKEQRRRLANDLKKKL